MATQKTTKPTVEVRVGPLNRVIKKSTFEKTIHQIFPFIYDPSCALCIKIRDLSIDIHKKVEELNDYELDISAEIIVKDDKCCDDCDFCNEQ